MIRLVFGAVGERDGFLRRFDDWDEVLVTNYFLSFGREVFSDSLK